MKHINRFSIVFFTILMLGCGQTEYSGITKAHHDACASSNGEQYYPENDMCICPNGIVCENGEVCNTVFNACIKHQLSGDYNYECDTDFTFNYARTSDGIIWEGKCIDKFNVSGALPTITMNKCEKDILYINKISYNCPWGCESTNDGASCKQKTIEEIECNKDEFIDKSFCITDSENKAKLYQCTENGLTEIEDCNSGCNIEMNDCKQGDDMPLIDQVSVTKCTDANTITLETGSSYECEFGCAEIANEARCKQENIKNVPCTPRKNLDKVLCFSNNRGESNLYKCNENGWEVIEQCQNGCDKTIRGCEPPEERTGEDLTPENELTNIKDLLKCIDKDTLDLKDGPFKCEFGCGISDGSARCKQPECKEIGGDAKCTIENGIDCSKNSKFYCIVSKDGKTANKYQCANNQWTKIESCQTNECNVTMDDCACEAGTEIWPFKCDSETKTWK